MLVFCSRALLLAGHLTAQWALELEMMLPPPARRRWLPCHTADAGCHKSYGVNKDPPRFTTSHSFCVLVLFINTVLFLSIFTLLPSHCLCLPLTISSCFFSSGCGGNKTVSDWKGTFYLLYIFIFKAVHPPVPIQMNYVSVLSSLILYFCLSPILAHSCL